MAATVLKLNCTGPNLIRETGINISSKMAISNLAIFLFYNGNLPQTPIANPKKFLEDARH